MSSSHAILRTLRRLRSPFVWAATLVYCATVLGLPTPLPALVEKEATEPFPCQHHRCGCHTAEQCRRHCCCFSEAEKTAWFAAQGLRNSASNRAVAAISTPAPKACCRSKHGGACDPAAGQQVQWVSHITAQKCQGLVTLWLALGAALPPVAAAAVPALDAPPQVGFLPADERADRLDFPPPVPPPQAV